MYFFPKKVVRGDYSMCFTRYFRRIPAMGIFLKIIPGQRESQVPASAAISKFTFFTLTL